MMPDLLKSKTVTARKPHGCQTCDATAIQPGEQYQRDTYIYDGRVYDWVQCHGCAAISGLVWEWSTHPEEGIGRGDYEEWARDLKDADTLEGERARWYLARIGVSLTTQQSTIHTKEQA
jgi:hypothetical protein